jgi:hypothetical protein
VSTLEATLKLLTLDSQIELLIALGGRGFIVLVAIVGVLFTIHDERR